jgi:hypothetical protein
MLFRFHGNGRVMINIYNVLMVSSDSALISRRFAAFGLACVAWDLAQG